MKLSEFKKQLSRLNSLNIVQADGNFVPAHFHITEVGVTTKHFVDCGGDVHTDKFANMQIWVANDVDHRLEPKGLMKIIELSNKVLGDEDLEIEVEYQAATIGKWALEPSGVNFKLVPKETDCLAKVKCDLPQPKQRVVLSSLGVPTDTCCTPGGGCC